MPEPSCTPPEARGAAPRAGRTRLTCVSSGELEGLAVRGEQFLQNAASPWPARRHGLGFRRLTEAAAVANYAPDQRVPVAPGPLGITPHISPHDLRRITERLRHHLGEFGIGEDVPFGISAHQPRADRVDHAADASLADRERAHRTRLDVGIKRAAGEILGAERLLRHADSHDLRMTRDVSVTLHAIGGLDNDLAVLVSDHAGERELTLLPGRFRQRDAARHHGGVERFGFIPIHSGYRAECFGEISWRASAHERAVLLHRSRALLNTVRAWLFTRLCIDGGRGRPRTPSAGLDFGASGTISMESLMSAQLASDIVGLARQVDPQSRRGFFMSSAAAAAAGYT